LIARDLLGKRYERVMSEIKHLQSCIDSQAKELRDLSDEQYQMIQESDRIVAEINALPKNTEPS
jgi:hypothetical protein